MLLAMNDANALGKRVYVIGQNYSWGRDVQRLVHEYASFGGYTVVGDIIHDVNKIQDFERVASTSTAMATRHRVNMVWPVILSAVGPLYYGYMAIYATKKRSYLHRWERIGAASPAP